MRKKGQQARITLNSSKRKIYFNNKKKPKKKKENNKSCEVHRELRRGNNHQQRMPAAGSNKNKNNKRTTKARNEFSQSMPPDRPVRHDATSNNNNRREGNPHINTHTHTQTHTWTGNVQACVHARLYIGGNYSALATGRRRRRRIVNDNNAHWANESLTPRDALLRVCVCESVYVSVACGQESARSQF